MPKAKGKPGPSSAAANGPPADVLTLAEAAAYLRLPPAEVVRLIRAQGLPAQQVGRQWRFLLGAIRDWLSKGKPVEWNKEAWRKLAGVWRDDPFFEDFLHEINQERDLRTDEEQE